MPDPAEQLARIYEAGFEIRQWDAYPGMAAVVRGECVALLKPGSDGLSIVGSPGWVIGERLGVKVQKDGDWVASTTLGWNRVPAMRWQMATSSFCPLKTRT